MYILVNDQEMQLNKKDDLHKHIQILFKYNSMSYYFTLSVEIIYFLLAVSKCNMV